MLWNEKVKLKVISFEPSFLLAIFCAEILKIIPFFMRKNSKDEVKKVQ